MAKESTRKHWENFWRTQKDLSQIYDNSGRIPRAIMEIFPDISGKLVLEVGAGTGRDSFTLAEKGANVFVLDYADYAMEIIKNLNKQSSNSRVLAVQGDALKLPFPDNTFDIVFHQGLLEHFRDHSKILSENVRVLKQNGILIVDVPQRWHIYTLVKHMLIPLGIWFAGWEKEFTLGQLENELKKYGLLPFSFYGDWMYPSFFYRVFREILWKIGIRLPLVPFNFPIINRLRRSLRELLHKKRIFCYTTLSIGVISKKGDK